MAGVIDQKAGYPQITPDQTGKITSAKSYSQFRKVIHNV
jgi:hypothetical protein